VRVEQVVNGIHGNPPRTLRRHRVAQFVRPENMRGDALLGWDINPTQRNGPFSASGQARTGTKQHLARTR
jgi:hypothetical protein